MYVASIERMNLYDVIPFVNVQCLLVSGNRFYSILFLQLEVTDIIDAWQYYKYTQEFLIGIENNYNVRMCIGTCSKQDLVRRENKHLQ